jgi:cysteinyl-tRNA synthetase
VFVQLKAMHKLTMNGSATQKKYLLQQIAALQMYVGYVEKGYSIASKGLNTIRDIKHGDFNLHSDFFNSLSAVNPTVKKYSKVASIIVLQISIAKQVRSTVKQCKKLTPAEINYLQQVFNNVLNDCAKNLDELVELITNGEEQMKDDERIKRIDKLYDEMQDKNVFVQSFSHSAKWLVIQRRNDQYDVTIERKLNGLQ